MKRTCFACLDEFYKVFSEPANIQVPQVHLQLVKKNGGKH